MYGIPTFFWNNVQVHVSYSGSVIGRLFLITLNLFQTTKFWHSFISPKISKNKTKGKHKPLKHGKLASGEDQTTETKCHN